VIHGILNVYKEKGYTSHDVVAKLRGILKQKKIGHTGTLDPDAEGVLPVCLGKATKLCDVLTDKDKTYETILLLGKTTDTQDITGKILDEREVTSSIKEIYESVQSFKGTYNQIPPMYSAVKINGKKLYELAREGVEIERKARKVTIHQLCIHEIVPPYVRMTITCSKGTYIRTLCHDIGERLGCGGCMEQLRRTRVDRFQIEDSLRLQEIEVLHDLGQLEEHIVLIDQMFEKYPAVIVRDAYKKFIVNGNPFYKHQIEKPDDLKEDGYVRVYDSDQNFFALYMYTEKESRFQLVKMFYEQQQC